LTNAGQNAKGAIAKAEAKKASWEELILAKRLGYMATLRNLRNILESNISIEAFESVLAYLSNDKAVQNSKQFPFRFLSAYAEIEKLKITGNSIKLVFKKDEKTDSKRIEKILEAIEKAINVSVQNLPSLEGETIILTDNSVSMGGDAGGSSAISAMSKINTASIANLFAALYWSRCDNTLVGLFGDRLVIPTLDRTKGVFDNYKTISKAGGTCGLGTEAGIFHMIEKLIKEKRKVARIVIFSDMQIGTGCSWYDTKGRRGDDFNKLYESYRKNINPDVKVYSVNLKRYGTTIFKGNVFKIAGWSEKIFNIMEILERDPNALISEINRIEFQ
jgi:60 kDa SS-A/Ro ribonucleoprotein